MRRDWTVKVEREADPYKEGGIIYVVIVRDKYGNILQVERNKSYLYAHEIRREIQEKINYDKKYANNGD